MQSDLNMKFNQLFKENEYMTYTATKKALKTSFACPFTQFDWGDYSADTDYLTFEEHGVYWNLLKRYYTTGPFDMNLSILLRMTRCPPECLSMVEYVLGEYFYVSDDDCWHHKRCDEEIMRAKHTSEVQSRKARVGASQRQRNPATGLFLSAPSSPATAGYSPAIKKEDVITQDVTIEDEITEYSQEYSE
jgi:uncharacterized protein YdaU (DUF1376 family)